MREHPEAWPNNKESDMSHSKTCYTCKQHKQVDQFRNHKSRADGLSSNCKDCDRAKEKIWRENNKEIKAAYDRAYRLANPESVRARQKRWELKNTEKEKDRKHAFYLENKELFRERGKIWAKNNPEKENQKKRNWRANNPEKALQERHKYRKKLKQNGIYEISEKDLKKLVSADVCYYCQKKDKLTLEHIIPVSRGGRHSIGNLVMVCKHCNFSKQARLLIEWKLKNA